MKTTESPSAGPSTAPDRPRRLPRRTWISVLGLATALGLLESTKAYVTLRLQGGAPSWPMVLLGNMPWWLIWAALVPLVVGVARRFRLDRRPRVLAAGAHVLAALAVSLLHLGLAGTLFYHTHGHRVHPDLASQLATLLNFYLFLEVLTYAAIVGGFYAVDYQRRFREGELAAARLEALAREARLSALRSQIHPHFLFNTLNAVSGLVRRGENDDAIRMIARLGDLLRLSLGRADGHEVPLEEELASLRTYLEIEHVRFRDRLAVDFGVDPAVRGARVPPLLLQPLAENAVRHGIAPTPGPGRITISAGRRGDVLVLEVENTGAAPPPGAEEEMGARGGIGLSNTRARLAHLYGPAAGLRLEPRAGGGAVARVTLPLHFAHDTIEAEPAEEAEALGAGPAGREAQ